MFLIIFYTTVILYINKNINELKQTNIIIQFSKCKILTPDLLLYIKMV